jgi:hypothetical protein
LYEVSSYHDGLETTMTPAHHPITIPTRITGRVNLALLWLAGIPLPIILLIWLFRH